MQSNTSFFGDTLMVFVFRLQANLEKEIFNDCAIIDVENKRKEEEIDDVLGIFGDSDSDCDADVTGEVKGIISKAGRLSLNMLEFWSWHMTK